MAHSKKQIADMFGDNSKPNVPLWKQIVDSDESRRQALQDRQRAARLERDAKSEAEKVKAAPKRAKSPRPRKHD